MDVTAFRVLGDVLRPDVFVTLSLIAVRLAESIDMLVFYVGPPHETRVALEDIVSIMYAPLLPRVDKSQAFVPVDPFDLEFNHVDLAYVDGIPAITNLDQALPDRSITVLVGPSGSGRLTLAHFIARFRDVNSDTIHLGGPDIREISNETLMQRISMVLREIYLSSTLTEENVRISRPAASDAKPIETTRWAGSSEVVERLPERWKTIAEEGGSALSGGERQRAAIARAFLKGSPVLLLDEATSALNGVDETSVTFALTELSAGCSVIVVAHRLSTTRRADRIPVLRGGAVKALGSHEELYEVGGTYREFWDDQSHVERWKIRGEEPRASLWVRGLRRFVQGASIASAIVPAPPTRLEPATIGLEGRCSTHWTTEVSAGARDRA